MNGWKNIKLEDALNYVQPTKHIVKSTLYDNSYDIPVLTPGKSFLLGFTNEKEGVYENVPTIIFDDFTTAFKYVDFPFKVKSSAMKMLETTSDDYDIKFLYYLMLTLKYEAEEHKRYWISKYSQQFVSVPPLEQQKKIVAILDAADEYRQKTKALITKYDELTQSLFLDMFGDPVSNPKGWDIQTIENITNKEKGSIKRGPFGGALKKEIFVEEGYLVYEQYHALNNDFEFARYYIDDAKFEELKGFSVKSGDIIISCSGVYLGKLAIIPKDAKEGIINQALLKVSLDQSKMTNHFFTYHFRQKNFRETFFDANRGAGIPNFPPMSEFKRFPFIVPPIEVQNQFEMRVQAIEAQKALAQTSLAKAEELFNSLLQRAFKGELL